MTAVTSPSYSIRQCGPGLAKGLARESRRTLAMRTVDTLEKIYRPLFRRWGVHLRRVSALRLLRSMRNALRPIEVEEIRIAPDEFEVVVAEVEAGEMRLIRARGRVEARPSGGYRVVPMEEPIARISQHAQERLHLRLSTAEWGACATELAPLLAIQELAPIARSQGLGTLWLPSPHGAFCIALDGDVPTVVTFLDELSHKRRKLIERINACLAEGNIAASLDSIGSD